MNKKLNTIVFGLFLLIFSSCEKGTHTLATLPYLPGEVPQGYSLPTEPDDNRFTEARFKLGKALFFDPIISEDSTKSCASCHQPKFGFADPRPLSEGVKGRLTKRNSPTLANVAYSPYFTFEGGVPTLEMQILVPLQEHNELNFNIVELSEKLKKSSKYNSMALEAYGQEPNPYVITRSLACFERSLLSFNSTYDNFINQNDDEVFNVDELAGYALFFSEKAGCYNCHNGINFTDYSFQNNGLYDNYLDEGRNRLTENDEDYALFKVPTLRNIELTAPYMHDGSIATLEEVIEHYNSGGANNPQKNPLIKPLNLSSIEKEQLLAFLKSLTDHTFSENSFLQP